MLLTSYSAGISSGISINEIPQKDRPYFCHASEQSSLESVFFTFLSRVKPKMTDIPQMVKDAILMASDPVPEDSVEVRGYDFSDGVNYRALLESFRTTGFQATHFGRAVEEINEMVRSSLAAATIVLLQGSV